MLRNFIMTAWRNLIKNKAFSLINILGLSTGLCCFLLILLFVQDELHFDRFNLKADRIYRVYSSIRFGGTDLNFPLSPDPMGNVLKNDYPQVEQFTRVYTSNGPKQIKKGNLYITEHRVAHVDSTFFEVFTFPVLSGITENALNEPNTVVITESMAKKYFGTTEAVGRLIETTEKGKTLYKVTAVIRDMPENGHFHFDFLFSMKNVDYNWGEFLSHNFYTYILLKPGTDYKAFNKNFVQYIDKYALPQARQFMQINSMEDFRKAGNKLEYALMPLTKIHLYSSGQHELEPGGNIQYVYIFSAVAVFILLIACINFMNLTTARSAKRAREVGIRKVLGTRRRDLVLQFLSESTLMVIISLAIALVACFILIPGFNSLAGKSIKSSLVFSPLILPWIIVLPLVVGLLAGLYPAFFLSAFRPIDVLKGKWKMGTKRGGSLRSLLVVFQFSTSIILILGTLVIYRQLHFIQTKNLGFNKDQVIIINNAGVLKENLNTYKTELLKLPGVLNGTVSNYLPTNSSRSDQSFSKSSTMSSTNGFNMQTWYVDEEYLNTMGMQVLKGRDFFKSGVSDSNAIIINQTCAGILGYADPVGKQIYNNNENGKSTTAFTIIGVIKDFNYESLKQPVGPLSLFLSRYPGTVSFRVNPAGMKGFLERSESLWKQLDPSMPFSYQFMDEAFADMYRSEQRVGKIAFLFATLAIVIASMGLFGLATFMAEQRMKEIGIRKVLGASVQRIMGLMTREFLRLVCISFIIAAPVAWWAMNSWLNDFAYRVQIAWWMFVVSALLSLFIALFTVSIQAFRAAIMNPVKSLKTE
ncbi:MAG TPA: cell division protein FtsX [Chitinophagaceae bacterium]|nr:cell division protein FtsX [Chitinophagaceae bacterium]